MPLASYRNQVPDPRIPASDGNQWSKRPPGTRRPNSGSHPTLLPSGLESSVVVQRCAPHLAAPTRELDEELQPHVAVLMGLRPFGGDSRVEIQVLELAIPAEIDILLPGCLREIVVPRQEPCGSFPRHVEVDLSERAMRTAVVELPVRVLVHLAKRDLEDPRYGLRANGRQGDDVE